MDTLLAPEACGRGHLGHALEQMAVCTEAPRSLRTVYAVKVKMPDSAGHPVQLDTMRGGGALGPCGDPVALRFCLLSFSGCLDSM